jgi:uncharacterized protein YyaL (SSP411 family)
MTGHGPDSSRVRDVLETALEWARERDYAGWDPYDGLNSPLLSAVCTNWFTRLVGMHGVHRAPVNLRPVLGVPRERNPKGVALFAMAHLNRYRASGDEAALAEAERLLTWLREHQSPGYERPAWGYNFDWQNGRKFFLPADEPSIVVSVFCGRAFLEHYRVTGSTTSLSVAAGTAAFIRANVNVRQVDGHRVFSYTPHDSFLVVNANALAAAFFAGVGAADGDDDLFDRACDLADFVVSAQTDDGGWYYAVPSSASHLSHDNFHTGFVLESLHRLASAGVDQTGVKRALQRGMAFYRTNLFEANGAPKFEHDTPYPRDAHAAAQAIRTFVVAGGDAERRLASQVLDWSFERLYDESGYFYRRRGRVLTDRTPYMRWSQAWMCYALSTVLADTERTPGGGHDDALAPEHGSTGDG